MVAHKKFCSGCLALLSAVFLFFFSEAPAFSQIKTPHLRLSFDNDFHIEGTGAGSLKNFPGSSFSGIQNLPAGNFVDGVRGMGFIPAEDLRIEGTNVFPAPEGTLSIWIKPVSYEEDWAGGKLLYPAKIGRFISTVLRDEDGQAQSDLQVRLYRHDCCSGLHWVEYWLPGEHEGMPPLDDDPLYWDYVWGEGTWPGSVQEFRLTGPQPPFSIWQEGRWRMLTVVWFKGERRVYLNGVRIQHGIDVERNPSIPGEYLYIPAGSKAVDELNIWDIPLTESQVAALFYSQMPQSGLSGAVQKVPMVSGGIEPGINSTDWKKAVSTMTWTDSYSGMAAESKPYSEEKDILELAHDGGYLFIRYREPMPEDYIVVSTLLGAEGMLRRRVTGRDNDVWQDDCVEVRLTPDGGETNYLLAVGAGGGIYDSKNGDAGFNLSSSDWLTVMEQDEKYWTVEMKVNLASLTGSSVHEEWGFNFARTVRQQGYARRQWSSAAGQPSGYGRILLSGESSVPVSAEMEWSSVIGRLNIDVSGNAPADIEIEYSVVPLNFLELFPEEEEVEARSGIMDMIRSTRRLEEMPLPVVEKILLPAGLLNWTGAIDYIGTELALASVSVSDSGGRIISERNVFISGSEAISARIFNLPSRRELVLQISLASETLVGDDVIAHIDVKRADSGESILIATIDGFNALLEELAIDVSDVEVGSHIVEISIEKAGFPLGDLTLSWFKSGDPVWLNNDIGVLKEVPEPWIPITHGRDSIEVWGREHRFSNSLLPSSMKVLGEEILAGPMRLIVEAEGEIIDTSDATTPAIVVDSAGIISDMKGRAEGRKIIVEIEGEMEFDGFGYFAFTLRPADPSRPVQIDRIIFEVPFKRKYAELYDDSDNNMFRTRTGPIPPDGMTARCTGAIRVGDTSRGVQFYPFFVRMGDRDAQNNLIFTPEGQAMAMRYEISSGLTLDRPVSNVLGIIGTPVKPFDAERIRKTGHSYGSVDAGLADKGYASTYYWFSTWTNHNHGGNYQSESGYFNYSPEWRKGFVESLRKDWVEKRHYGLLKLQPYMITAHSPEYALFWREWGGQYHEGLEDIVIDLAEYEGADRRPPGNWTQVEWKSRSWQDFFFYSIDKVLGSFAEQEQEIGVYVDVTHHEGDPRPYRRWVQRLYSIMRQHSPDGLMAVHMSGDRKMAVWGMFDTLVEGEQYSANWTGHMVNNPGLTLNDCFPTVLPLERTRATYTTSLWGPQQVFLSQLWTCTRQGEDVFRQDNPGKTAPSYTQRKRHITGLMLVHEAYFWGEFYACGVKDPQYPWVRRARWGYDETAQFVPYWDNSGKIEVESPDDENIVVSGWFRPDGKLMLVVFNDTDSDVDVTVKVAPEKFPVLLREFKQAEDITSPVPSLEPGVKEPHIYPYADNTLSVDMRARDFRLLILE